MENVYNFVDTNTNLDHRWLSIYNDLNMVTSVDKFPYNILKQDPEYKDIKNKLKHLPIKEKQAKEIQKDFKNGGVSDTITVFTF